MFKFRKLGRINFISIAFCEVYEPALCVLPELATLVLLGVEGVAAAAVAVLAAVALLPRLHDPVPARRGRD